MTTVEETIKQVFRSEREFCERHIKHTSPKALKELEKDVLQILAQCKCVPLKDWRELLKLVENRPFKDYKNYIPQGKDADQFMQRLNNIHSVYQKHLQKIEGKLEEIEK